MSTVVGGFLVPHVPAVLVEPDAPPPAVRDEVMGAYAEAARRLAALDPTAVVIVGADHYILFGPRCLPQMVIATGEVDGPVERFPGIPRRSYPTNEALAGHIRDHTAGQGFDWAVARTLTIDHSVALPYELVVRPHVDLPLVPVYLASGVEPYIPLRRAVDLGAAIGRAVAADGRDERVVVIGSGGISHTIGLPAMGEVNPAFDHEVLGLLTGGRLDELAAMTDERILAEGGNGGLEVRNLACAAAAVGGTGEVIAYAAVPEWVTGMGFVELRPHQAVPA